MNPVFNRNPYDIFPLVFPIGEGVSFTVKALSARKPFDGEYTVTEDSYYVAITGSSNLYAQLLAEYLELTDGQFSFEARMGCGFGACMGCSCQTKYGNKRICKDGPVFLSTEVEI